MKILAVIISLLVLCSCSAKVETPAELQAKEVDYKEIAKTVIMADVDRALSYIDTTASNEQSKPFEKTYWRDDLNDEQKKLYDEMLEHVKNYEYFIYEADKYGYETLDNVLSASAAIARDYPLYESFWNIFEVIDGETTTALESIYFNPCDINMTPVSDPKTIEPAVKTFDAVCDYVVESMPKNIATAEKYKYLAAVISLRTSYDYDSDYAYMTSTAFGSVMGGHSICQGYAAGFYYLCEKANLDCDRVDGLAGDNMTHMWNSVEIDGETRHIDVTWCDNGYTLPGDEGWMQYFMVTTEQISFDHVIG